MGAAGGFSSRLASIAAFPPDGARGMSAVTIARSGPSVIRILVAEMNQLFLDATVDMFGLVPDFEVVQTVLAPEKVVDQVRRTSPLVVVLGVGGAGYHRLDLARKVLEVSPLS